GYGAAPRTVGVMGWFSNRPGDENGTPKRKNGTEREPRRRGMGNAYPASPLEGSPYLPHQGRSSSTFKENGFATSGAPVSRRTSRNTHPLYFSSSAFANAPNSSSSVEMNITSMKSWIGQKMTGRMSASVISGSSIASFFARERT